MASLCHSLVAVLLLASAAWPVASRAVVVEPPDAEREMVRLSNAFRSEHGLPALHPQPALLNAARGFADYMARTNRYGHTADGREPDQRAEAARYGHCMVAENIAWQYRSDGFSSGALAKGFVEGWLASPPHRRNLLSPQVTDMAIAVAHSAATGRWYAVQMLARPLSLRIRFELSNRSAQPVRYAFEGREFQLAPAVTRWHESCSGRQLEIRLPGQADPLQLQPQSGARYWIDTEPGRHGLRVRSE